MFEQPFRRFGVRAEFDPTAYPKGRTHDSKLDERPKVDERGRFAAHPEAPGVLFGIPYAACLRNTVNRCLTRSDMCAPCCSQCSMRATSRRSLISAPRATGLNSPTLSRLVPPWRLRLSVTTT